MPKKQQNIIKGKFQFEFRYDPLIQFSDWKGRLTERMIKEFKFDAFRIDNNRVEITNADPREVIVFVAISNAGLLIENTIDEKQAVDITTKFINFLSDFKEYKPKIARIGCRWNFIQHRRNISLEKLKEVFIDKIVQTKITPYKDINGEIIDIGLPINFKNKDYMFNVIHGPMDKNQALAQFFTTRKIYQVDDFPKHGLFVDIDVFKEFDQQHKFCPKKDSFIKIVEKTILFGMKTFSEISDGIFSLTKNE